MNGVRPKLLDLFCKAGGAAMGYHRAGFDVVGVDIEPQPNYPFEFIQADALALDPAFIASFDAIHASPPCQRYSQMSVRYADTARASRPDLIAPVRQMLEFAGLPFVIENVNGARHELKKPFRLTGEMFGLGVHRPRWFESNAYILAPIAPPKQPDPIAVYGARMDGRLLWKRTDGTELRAPRSIEPCREAMGIDWMDWDELKESIPPAYTQFIGRQLFAHIEAQRKAA
jgi:DNA (cytosine-5)-methyltransferase 1